MKYLGVDFGLRRVGLAVSRYGQVAEPWKIIRVSSLKDAVGKTLDEARKEGIDKVVVGLPEGKIGKTVLDFIKLLGKEGVAVEAADENLSSRLALDWMIKANVPKNKRRFTDDYSAAIILQGYLDNK